MSQQTEQQSFTQIADLLSKEENRNALLYLIDKLPDIAKSVQTVDDITAFTQHTLQDKESMEDLFQEMEDKLGATHLHKETFDSLTRLLQLLPTVVPLLEKLVDVSMFVTETAQDKESMDALSHDMAPVTALADESLDVMKETNRRVQNEKDLPNVSIFKLLSLLKDPTVRRGYQYVNTFLNVLSEKDNKEA